MKDNNIILEIADMSKTELKSFIKDIFDSEIKNYDKKVKKEIFTKQDIKDIVKDMMIKQYRFFWEKKNFWSNSL